MPFSTNRQLACGMNCCTEPTLSPLTSYTSVPGAIEAFVPRWFIVLGSLYIVFLSSMNSCSTGYSLQCGHAFPHIPSNSRTICAIDVTDPFCLSRIVLYLESAM